MKKYGAYLKTFVLILVILFIPVFCAFYFIYLRYTGSIMEYSFNAIQNTLTSDVVKIEQKLSAVDSVSSQLVTLLSQKRALMNTDAASDPKALFDAASSAFNDCTAMLRSRYEVEGFRNFYLYLSGCSTMLLSDYTAFGNISYSDYDLHALPENRWGVSVPLSSMLTNPYNAALQSERTFAKNYPWTDDNDQDIILTACVNEQYINELLTENLTATPAYALILDSYGRPMSSMKQSEIGTFLPKYVSIFDHIKKNSPGAYSEITIGGTDYLLNFVHSDFHNWYFVIATECDSLIHNPLQLLPSLIIIIPFTMLIAWILTCLFFRFRRKSEQKLAETVSSISSWVSGGKDRNDPPPAVSFQASPVLTSSFETLISSVKNIFSRMEKQRVSSTDSEIRRLQTEINPHMIYNSLESVYSMARINDQDEIADLVMALSKYFRIALSGGRGSVPFRDAYELANQYIIVQNIRMNYMLSFHADIDEAVWPVMVPKFLLQPVVENSIVHGFQNRRDNWNISIRAGFEGDRILITVTDTGSGLMETEVQAINQKLNEFNFDSTTNNKGYALRNINYQLKTQYGEDSYLRVFSTYGEGTTVEISLNCGTP